MTPKVFCFFYEEPASKQASLPWRNSARDNKVGNLKKHVYQAKAGSNLSTVFTVKCQPASKLVAIESNFCM